MLEIIETPLNLSLPLGQHPHCLLAQIPDHLVRGDQGYVVPRPEEQWARIRSVLELVTEGNGSFRKLHFLVFPEGCLPLAHLDDMFAGSSGSSAPARSRCSGSSTCRSRPFAPCSFAFETTTHARWSGWRQTSSRGATRPCRSTYPAWWSGRTTERPGSSSRPRGTRFTGRSTSTRATTCTGKGRPPLPGHGVVQLHGPHLPRLPVPGPLLLEHPPHRRPRQPELLKTRQGLDALFVIQANPKPEHQAYRDVLSGFYGEYLEDTRAYGTRSPSSGTAPTRATWRRGGARRLRRLLGGDRPPAQARSVALSEFSFDDFGGAPLHRLRFGTATRLYYFNLPLHHELDPRSSRMPLKVHGIFCPTPEGSGASSPVTRSCRERGWTGRRARPIPGASARRARAPRSWARTG